MLGARLQQESEASLWATAHAAVTIADAAVRAVSAGEQTLSAAPGSEYEIALKYMNIARDLIRDPKAIWPSDLPRPDVETSDPLAKRVNNLFYGSMGWVLLHEIGHLVHGHQASVPADLRLRQENEADAYATEWVFAKANEIPTMHREFRAFAVATAMLWLGLIDEVRRGSVTHPHSSERLSHVRSRIPLQDDSPGLELAVYVLKTAFLPSVVIPEVEHAASGFDQVVYEYARRPR